MKRFNVIVASWLVLALAAPSTSFAVPSSTSTSKKKKKKTDAAATDQATPPPSPAQAQPSTKGLEAKLKKEEEEEPTRLAPAALPSRPGAEVTKDEKADQRRDEEIDEVKKVLLKQKDPNVRAQLYFKLGELWWEKSQFVHINKEMPAFDQTYKEYTECRQKKKVKSCGAEPIPNTRMSELYRSNAVDLYKETIKLYPKYNRVDEIRYYLAYNIMETASTIRDQKKREAMEKQAIDVYKQLVALNPHSDYVADAFVQLGNYYFDHKDLMRAEAAFKEAIKLDKSSKTYAIYKLAWVRFNQGQYGEKDEPKKGDCGSVCFLKQVVERSEKEDKKNQTKLNIRSEALNDLVLSFARNGERDSAVKYYELKAGRDGSKRYVIKLANEFFTAGGAQYDDAIKMYQYLINKQPLDRLAPEWQSKIVLAYDKKSNRPKVREEIQRLVDRYGDKSDWAKVQKKEELGFTHELVEEALYNLVTDYHQEAIKTKSVATYKLARDIYKEYIDNFPDTERAYMMRYYYAEILYALEQYQDAYEQYVKVADDNSQKQFRVVAAKDMLLAAEKLVDIENGKYTIHVTDDSKVIDEYKDKGGVAEQHIKAKVEKDKAKEELTKFEQQLVTACDHYGQLVPNAPDEARVKLRAAVIFFDHYRYVEAADRFGYIIAKWPEQETSKSAAGLVLEALEAKQEWAALNKRAREFAANKKLLVGEKKAAEFKDKLQNYIQNSTFQLALLLQKTDEAKSADEFATFMKEFPASHYAPIAGYNAFIEYQKLKHLDTAIDVGEKLIAAYPKADDESWKSLPGGERRKESILPDLTFRLAKTYELTADFERAARWYETYVKNYKDNKQAPEAQKQVPDAQFNAALWYKSLGEDEKAIAAFQNYIDIYKKVPPKDREELKLVPDAQVFWTIVQFYESERQWSKFITKTNDYLKGYPNEPHWQIFNAKCHQYQAFKALDDSKNMTAMARNLAEYYRDTLKEDDKARESSKACIAETQFFLLQPEYEAYEKIKFRGSGSAVMKEDLKTITNAKNALAKKYTEIVAYGNGDWAIAALVRIGQLPRLMATKMRNAPVPYGLDKDQKEMYKGALEDKAIEIETPAVDLLLTAMKKSFELGIYNEWTIQAQQALAEFKPELVGKTYELPLKGSTFFFTANDTSAPATPKADTKQAAASPVSGGGTQ
jgi:tetratricopeptide (TPR) repeat protein